MTATGHSRVAARFDCAAATYDDHSAIQRAAAQRLAAQIAGAGLPPRPRVLEIGCGTGHLTRRLSIHLPGAHILATDIAPGMVAACRAGLPHLDFAVMDGAHLAVTGPFDLICASLAAQWFDHLPATLAHLAARLAPGGLLALSLLGENTFHAWRTAHLRLGLPVGARSFPSVADYEAAFPPGNLQLTVEQFLDRPPSALDFLRALRAIGADTPAPGHTPLTPGHLRQVLRTLDPMPDITYEVVYALWRRAVPYGVASINA